MCGVFVFDSARVPPPSRLRLLLLRSLFVTTTLSHTIFHTQLCHTLSFTPHLSHTTLSHTLFHTPSFTQNFVTLSFTHNFVTHNFVTHSLSHTIFHTPSFTHNFVTHSLSHTIFHTPSFHTQLFHTQLCHTLSFTHNFVTHSLSHTLSFTHHLSHTTLAHTLCVALGGMDFHNACQAWHFATSTFVSRGQRGTYGTGLALATSTCVSRGRRSTWRHRPSFSEAGVALVALGWLWWHAWSLLVTRGAAPLCVADVALGDIDVPFASQAWHLATSTCVWRGRRGTWRHRFSLRVAGVRLAHMNFRFAWQA